MQVAEAIRKPTAEQIRRKALDGVAKLPPFSAVMNKLMATLANQDISFGEVAALIEQDTVLAGNVLKLVNSAAYGRRGTVNSVRHAVSLLGLDKVRNAAMTVTLSATAIGPFSPGKVTATNSRQRPAPSTAAAS